MEIHWLTIFLMIISQIALSWYCSQLAEEKGYSGPLFASLGIIPIINLIALLLLLLMADRRLAEHKLHFSKHRQHP